jgi:hypothetical protein
MTRFFSYGLAFFYLLIICLPIAIVLYATITFFYSIGMLKRFIKKRFYDNRTKNRKRP